MPQQVLVSRSFVVSSILFILSFCAVTSYAVWSGVLSVLLTYSFTLLTGYYFFRKVDALRFFTASFFLNTIFAVLVSLYFDASYGLPFSEGGDDQAFYEISKKLKNGESVDFSALNYKAYVLTFAVYFKALHSIGITSDYFLHLNILNSFFGALAAPLIFLIGRQYTNEKNASAAAVLTLLYPPFIFYSAIIIRDILVATLLFAIIYTAMFWQRRAVKKDNNTLLFILNPFPHQGCFCLLRIILRVILLFYENEINSAGAVEDCRIFRGHKHNSHPNDFDCSTIRSR